MTNQGEYVALKGLTQNRVTQKITTEEIIHEIDREIVLLYSFS